jgi:ABC-2 type transport system ATP-binding protein
VVARNIGELSKGYRQRVGLSQAILHDPEILILDEPTSGLDPNQIVEIRELIKTLGREKTVILSTHILPEVKATCSRVMIIADGRLVADDTPDGLESRAAGGAGVIATFRGPGAAIEAALTAPDSGLDGLFGARRFVGSAGPGLLTWRFEVPAGADRNATAEAVYRLAAGRDWGLTELRHDAASLEDVFRRLTGGDHGPGAGGPVRGAAAADGADAPAALGGAR